MDGAPCVLCSNVFASCVNDEVFYAKVKKYLDIDVEKSTIPFESVCTSCIESIEQFHEYYERVRSVQLIKKELSNRNETNTHEIYTIQEHHAVVNIEEKISETFCAPEYRLCEKKQLPQTYENISLRKETEKFYRIFECPLCKDGTLYAGLVAIEKHFMGCHKDTPYINCCSKDFPLNNLLKLKRHLRIHTQPESCTCDVCHKVLSSPRHMRLHRELHTPMSERSMFQCDECGRKCGGKAELYRHVRSIHSPQESMCNICGKEFRRRVTFQTHMRIIHGDQKQHTCVICPKTYKSAGSLKEHSLKAHHNKPTKTKQCPICEKRMGAVYISNHILRCHSNETPYNCTNCDKKFKLPGDLRSHLISHSKERPYSCAFCDNAFKSKATLRSHISQHTGGEPVQCPYCNKIISCYSNFLAHRRRMHSLEHISEVAQKNKI